MNKQLKTVAAQMPDIADIPKLTDAGFKKWQKKRGVVGIEYASINGTVWAQTNNQTFVCRNGEWQGA